MQLGPKKLIVIRSGSYEYAELDLRASLQLVGPNNVGKTTLINTLQFLYVDSRKDMVFGDHDWDSTRDFYFPDQYSYVLFECLGPRGSFVLGWRGHSKAIGGDPLRFCYEGEYLSSDFINAADRVEEPKAVLSKLGVKGYCEVKDAAAHREAILVGTKGEANAFGLLQLKENEQFRHFKEVLKNLLSLRSIDQAEMKRSLLMLAGISLERPALEAKSVVGEEFDRIKEKRQRLEVQKSLIPKMSQYIKLATEHDTGSGQVLSMYGTLQVLKQARSEKHNSIKAEIVERQAALELTRFEQEEQVKELDKLIKERAASEGKLLNELEQIKQLYVLFDDFIESLEREALQNIRQQISALEQRLLNAQQADEGRTKAQLANIRSKVSRTRETIRTFDDALITVLRGSMKDSTLKDLAGLFNIELLQLPVADGVIELKQKEALLELLKEIGSRIGDNRYSDENISLPINTNETTYNELQDVHALKKALTDLEDEQKRLVDLVISIEEREQLRTSLADCKKEEEQRRERLVQWERLSQAKTREPILMKELEVVKKELHKTETDRDATRQQCIDSTALLIELKNTIESEEKQFHDVIRMFGSCEVPNVLPDTQSIPVQRLTILEDAVAIYRKACEEHEKRNQRMNELARDLEHSVGSSMIGTTYRETALIMQEQVDGIPAFEEAIRKDWDQHFHMLRAYFQNALKGLDDIRSAVTNLNRRFGNVTVSNLQSLRLEVVEQSDLVQPLRQMVSTDHSGLFEDREKVDADYESLRRKLSERLRLYHTDLFALRFIVTGSNGKTLSHDNLQVESHGTSITIKVLFNLLVLRSILKDDPKLGTSISQVPFFLDEVHSLDPHNRMAVLKMAKDLGFLALTAAPEPVSEVEAIYFLRPQNGKLVVRQERKVRIRAKIGEV